MESFIATPEYQAYDHAAEILAKSGNITMSGTMFADEYRRIDAAGLSFNERMNIAALMEINILCVGYNDDGEIEVITK